MQLWALSYFDTNVKKLKVVWAYYIISKNYALCQACSNQLNLDHLFHDL